MKILLITNNYPLSASTSVWAPFCIRELALALVRAGAEVLVLAPDHAGKQEGEPGPRVRRIPWSGRHEMDLISLKLGTLGGLRHALSLLVNGRREVAAVLQEFHPDFCLAAWALPSGEFARQAWRKAGVPYAVWCLGSDIHTLARRPLFRALIRRILRRADLRYADGFRLARETAALAGQPCDFMATTRRLRDGTAAVSLDPDRVHFLFVGRWETVKGLDVLIDAWEHVVSAGRGRDAMLHIVGQGTGLRPAVERAARQLALRDSLRVWGWVSEAELAGLYAAISYVVIPSRIESIPVVLSETLAQEKPLIVTDVGDMGELVRKYRLGRVVPPGSPDALARALADFIDDGYAFEDLGALAEARGLFDVDRTARRFLADVSGCSGHDHALHHEGDL